MPSSYSLSGSGAGTPSAPVAAGFIVTGNDSTLTQERVLTGTTNKITLTDNGAGNTLVLNVGSDITQNTDSQTLTNKTIDLSSNTLTGTLASFNTSLSDADFVSIAGAETLTNKTLTTPSIGSFVNANHNHQNVAGGGQLTDAAFSSPISVSKGGTGLTALSIGDMLYASSTSGFSTISAGANGQVLMTVAGVPTWQSFTAGSGSVTSVSIVNTNGFSGSVISPTTAPAISIQTTITGVLKGDGTAISAATDSDITGKLLTGYVSGAGTIASTDSILQAIQKLNGNIASLSSGGITSLNGLTGSPQTFANDTNITISSSGFVHTLGFTGTLASSRLNSNVVQAITNDSNVTGTISTQTLTLGWTGQLSASRGGTGLDTSGLSGVPKISSGTWTVGTITETQGGTNQTAYSTGDILYASSANTLSKLPVGSNGQVLTVSSGLPVWATSSSSSSSRTVTTQTSSYTALTTDDVILVNATTATITLPSASSAGSGNEFMIKKIGSAYGTITITATSGNIDGSSTNTSITNQYESLTVVSDGSNYYII